MAIPSTRQPPQQLPAKPAAGGCKAEGHTTPCNDKRPQQVSVPAKRVIPIVFLPGIMGSNLRMTGARQAELKKSNNIAWRPDRKAEALKMVNAKPRQRQLQLDPEQTEVDVYDPIHNPTGDLDETADQRHDNARVGFDLGLTIETPLLMDDLPTAKPPRKTKEQKARERGWGEIYFSSYSDLLEICELRLNTAFSKGKMDEWWRQIVGVAPAEWQASPEPPLQPLTEGELKQAVSGCWFPVHAMGYNWLESNRESGTNTAKRIEALIKSYQGKYSCEKVIIVTHSMGGLVARALIHPKMGNLEAKVLGVVHGVQPALGAGTAYKRMRCGFEDSTFDPAPKVLGNYGSEVTAVLGNSPGGLELLPNQAYGNGWLRAQRDSHVLARWPMSGDPYEDIYKRRVNDKWYALLQEDWINPARDLQSGFARTARFLDQAKQFHNDLAGVYHQQSYAHYGVDPGHPAWHDVTWQIADESGLANVEPLQIVKDDKQGSLWVIDPKAPSRDGRTRGIAVTMGRATGAGDQTVPMESAEDQLNSGTFKGIFRQRGYEHQASYKDERALHSTLYCLVRIALTMQWSES